MHNGLSDAALQEIARQLSCPDGEDGIKTAERMSINNLGMTKSAIRALNLAAHDVVLEIGMGSASHLPYLLGQAKHLQYFGADISRTMIDEASRANIHEVNAGKAHFYLVDSGILPFPTLRFDHVFTVNTLYFWKNPQDYLLEIKRVLKPHGSFVLCFANQEFMKKLPFTAYGFNLYTLEEIKQLLTAAGFTIKQVLTENEPIMSQAGTLIDRTYHTISVNS